MLVQITEISSYEFGLNLQQRTILMWMVLLVLSKWAPMIKEPICHAITIRQNSFDNANLTKSKAICIC